MNKNYRKIMFLAFGVSLFGLAGCPSTVDGIVNEITSECLSHGENCSSSYISENYGVSSLSCCTSGDVCQKQFSSSTVLTCN